MTRITKMSLFVASPDQVSADVSPDLSGDIIILQLKDGIYYELNETGARVWSMAQQPCSFATLLENLLEEYDVDAQQCEADLMALLRDMISHGLIEVLDDGSDQ